MILFFLRTNIFSDKLNLISDPAQIKTPHNTNHNTPIQYTPKNTPTTPMNGGDSAASRSR